MIVLVREPTRLVKYAYVPRRFGEPRRGDCILVTDHPGVTTRYMIQNLLPQYDYVIDNLGRVILERPRGFRVVIQASALEREGFQTRETKYGTIIYGHKRYPGDYLVHTETSELFVVQREDDPEEFLRLKYNEEFFSRVENGNF